MAGLLPMSETYELTHDISQQRQESISGLLISGLLLGLIMSVFLYVVARPPAAFGLRATLVPFLPILVMPMILIGIRRPYTALIIACLLAIEDPRLNATLGDIQQKGYAMWPLYVGVAVSPSNIFLVLIAILSFIWPSHRRIPRPLLAYALVIIVVGMPGLLMAKDFPMAFSAWLLHVVVPVIICVNSVRSIKDPAALHRLWLLLLIGILVPAVYHSVTRLGMSKYSRSAIANQMTPYALGLIPVAFYWATRQSKGWQRLVGAICAVAFVVVIWISGSRTGAVMALLYLTWRGLRSIAWLARRPGVLAVSALVVILLLAYVTSSLAFQAREHTLLSRFGALAQTGISGTPRWHLWIASSELIKEDPIFGIGLNNTRVLLDYSSSHQIILSVWLEMGFLGLLAFLGICIYYISSGFAMLWRLPSGDRKNDVQCTLDMFMLTFAYLQVSGYLYGTFHTSGTFYFHTLLACGFLTRCFAREEYSYVPVEPEALLVRDEVWVY